MPIVTVAHSRNIDSFDAYCLYVCLTTIHGIILPQCTTTIYLIAFDSSKVFVFSLLINYFLHAFIIINPLLCLNSHYWVWVSSQDDRGFRVATLWQKTPDHTDHPLDRYIISITLQAWSNLLLIHIIHRSRSVAEFKLIQLVVTFSWSPDVTRDLPVTDDDFRCFVNFTRK